MNESKRLELTNYLFICGKFLFGALILIIGHEYLLNHKIYDDSINMIYNQYAAVSGKGLFNFVAFDGFGNVAKIYKILLFNKVISFNSLLLLSFVMYIMLFIFMIKNIMVIKNYKLWYLFLLFFVFDVIFLCQPSKDFFALLTSVITLVIMKKNDNIINNIIIIFLLITYSYLFRQYYLLIMLIYYFLKVTCKLKIKITPFLCAFIIIMYYLYYKTNYLNIIIDLRFHNDYSLKGHTNTLISNILPYNLGEKNLGKFILNYFMNAFRIMFPIELFWKSTSRGFVFFPIQVSMILIFMIRIRQILVMNKKDICKYDYLLKNIKTAKNIILYCISYFIVSVLFEPDFGSIFRHNMALMPFVLYLAFSFEDYNNFERFKENDDILHK